jgi:Ca2+-binding EF-hand superfamily protein
MNGLHRRRPAEHRRDKMTLTFKHSAALMAALLGAAVSTAALAQNGPMEGGMGGMMMSFDTLDADKDGKVTQDEMTAHRAARFAEADANKDGKLSADELIVMREKAEAARKAEMAAAMIARIDTDKDGLVSVAEMDAMPMMGKMFERVDGNADGAITQDEMEAARAEMGEHMQHGEGHGKGHGKHGGGFWNWMMGDDK